MKDITNELAAASTTSTAWKSLMLRAIDEIEWLRREAKMWRLRATQAACDATVEPSTPIGSEVRQTKP